MYTHIYDVIKLSNDTKNSIVSCGMFVVLNQFHYDLHLKSLFWSSILSTLKHSNKYLKSLKLIVNIK